MLGAADYQREEMNIFGITLADLERLGVARKLTLEIGIDSK